MSVLKSDYINQINTMRVTPAARSVAVTGTDITRASAVGTNVATPSTIDPNATTGDLPGTAIDGSDIQDTAAGNATAWARVRRLIYRQETSGGAIGLPDYTRYGRIFSPNPATSIPASGNSFYDILDAGQPVSQTAFNSLIASLNVQVVNETNLLQATILYCHSSIPPCHTSRGRR